MTDPRFERIEWFQQQRYGDLTTDEKREYHDLIVELAAEAKAAVGSAAPKPLNREPGPKIADSRQRSVNRHR